MHNWPETLLSQYVNSSELVRLIEDFNEAVDPQQAIEALYRKVFDPATAEGWGLDCWGTIVAMPRLLKIPGTPESFGFEHSRLHPWDQAPFYSSTITDNYVLNDRAYRLLIFLKAAVNLTNGSLADINRLLAQLFPNRGNIAALHVGTMHMRFLVQFVMEPFEQALMRTEAVPPKPAGVLFDWYYVPVPTFGFDKSGLHPWNQGTFPLKGPIYVEDHA